MDTATPSLVDLVRDWLEDEPTLAAITIDMEPGQVDARFVINRWICGYFGNDLIDFRYANIDGTRRFGILYAADPEFFEKLRRDLIQMIVIRQDPDFTLDFDPS